MEIHWSPNHDDRFYTFGTHLCLYRICEMGKGPPSKNAMKISENSFAELLNIMQDVKFKCAAWQPNSNQDLVALDMPKGKIILISSLNDLTKNIHELDKNNRPCLHLAWNYLDNNLLAAVIDKSEKSRGNLDHSIIIWDVKNKENFGMEKKLSTSDMGSLNKPLVEIGAAETCLSFAWLTKTQRTFVAGMNGKFIKVYDIKDGNKHVNMVSTKAIYSLTVSPFNDSYIASFNDKDEITIFDLRNFVSPIATIPQNQKIKKLSWSLTSGKTLGCSFTNSPNFKFIDFHSNSDDRKLYYIDRYIQTGSSSQPIASFDWHRSNKGRLLVVSQSGNITDHTVAERVPIDWSPSSLIGCNVGQNIGCFNTFDLQATQNDISNIMKIRAKKRYGLKRNLRENIGIIGDDDTLKKLWTWLSGIKPVHHIDSNHNLPTSAGSQATLSQITRGYDPSTIIGKLQSPSSPDFGQLKNMVRGERVHDLNLEGVFGILKNVQLDSKPAEYFFRDVRGYRKRWCTWASDERNKIIESCGWQPGKENSFKIINRLVNENCFERAAAICVFTLHIRTAVDILKNAKQAILSTVAMALAGYQEDDQNLWREICSDLLSSLNDAYLKAIFYFLTTSIKSFDGITNNNELELADRVAFAAIYLPDKLLGKYLAEQADLFIESGNPIGLLLTGVTDAGLPLLKNYIDRTGDIQTAVVVVAQAVGDLKFEEFSLFEIWFEEYRSFLDRLEMWVERAELDIFIQKVESSIRPGRLFTHMHDQVHVICNFCAKPISNDAVGSKSKNYSTNFGGTIHAGPITPTNSGANPLGPSQRIQSCPHCRKALPRCSICMLYLGTPAGVTFTRFKVVRPALADKKLSKIDDWFVWCRTCFHGGHAEHMTNWFRLKKECPVSGCNCKCSSLDFKRPQSSADRQSLVE